MKLIQNKIVFISDIKDYKLELYRKILKNNEIKTFKAFY